MRACVVGVAAVAAAACGRHEAAPRRAGPELAYCRAAVVDVGVVDIELEYLPRVVACEHAAAGYEALKAQAIAARAYLYYRLDTGGSILDGIRDQVLSCAREPLDVHRQAVSDTAYQVLTYGGRPVAGFFVAGAEPRGPRCVGRGDDSATERFVTYNDDRRGARVQGSSIGSGDVANRGCLSQRGADCLAKRGWEAEAILRRYYGDDIELSTVDASVCLDPEGPRFSGWSDRRRVGVAALVLALCGVGAVGIARPPRRGPRRRTRRR